MTFLYVTGEQPSVTSNDITATDSGKTIVTTRTPPVLAKHSLPENDVSTGDTDHSTKATVKPRRSDTTSEGSSPGDGYNSFSAGVTLTSTPTAVRNR